MLKVLTIKVLLFFSAVFSLHSQGTFIHKEDSLKKLLRSIPLLENDFERLEVNYIFKNYFHQVLKDPESFHYPFDSLTVVSRLRDPQGNFRIITWYIPLDGGNFEYYGFFQSFDPRRDDYQVYELTDRGSAIGNIMFETLGHENWYGAYYLELIHRRHRRNDYYVMLGWRGDNPLTRKRIIEPLRLMGQGRPSFGSPVFRFENNRHRRVIFEYSARVSMSMRYEPHIVDQSRRSQDVIIFDRMAPPHNYLRGQFQFYVPETNIFDGFRFEDGKWIFVPDIDARNPNRRPPPRPVPPN